MRHDMACRLELPAGPHLVDAERVTNDDRIAVPVAPLQHVDGHRVSIDGVVSAARSQNVPELGGEIAATVELRSRAILLRTEVKAGIL